MQSSRKFYLYTITAIILLPLVFHACSDNSPTGPDASDFDRQAILVNWADNIIIPAYTNFTGHTTQLHDAAEAFTAAPGQETLETLRENWESAYLAFQRVSLFDTGPAKEIMLRDFLNTYPVKTELKDFDPSNTAIITENIESGSYNLDLPVQRVNQGFPALDYLLYGLSDTDTDILDFYTTGTHAANYRFYLTELTSRIHTLTEQVHSEWTNGYRDQFVSNSGSGQTASLDMVVNDLNLYYENRLRAGKVGIPAGVLPAFPGAAALPDSSKTEAHYRGDLSKSLLLEALSTVQDFFNGKHTNSGQTGESLKSYLDYLNTMKQGEDLSRLINNQFDTAREAIDLLNDNFTEQIESESGHTLMLKAYNELQKNVVYMKTDLAQALGVGITYIDNDGD